MTLKTNKRSVFPLFQTPLDLAHTYWDRILQGGDLVVDATCGNGRDTAVLADLLEKRGGGNLYAFDIQQSALDETAKRCSSWLLPSSNVKLSLFKHCHSSFPEELLPATAGLIVYNLGYLPGGDKNVTTLTPTTLQSINEAMHLLRVGGLMSITCYPGHEEGRREEQLILEFAERLTPENWSCCHHRWVNRRNAPSLLLIQKGTARITDQEPSTAR